MAVAGHERSKILSSVLLALTSVLQLPLIPAAAERAATAFPIRVLHSEGGMLTGGTAAFERLSENPEVGKAAGNTTKTLYSTLLIFFLLHTAELPPPYLIPPLHWDVSFLAIPKRGPGVQKKRCVKKESLITI